MSNLWGQLREDLIGLFDDDFLDVSYNDDFTTFMVSTGARYYDREEILGMTMFVMMFHIFSGANLDQLNLELEHENEVTGKLFDTNTLPDDL